MQKKRGTRLSKRWKRILLVATSFAMALLSVEVFIRLTWSTPWQIPRDAYESSDTYIFRLRPNYTCEIPIVDSTPFRVVTNSRGFRGPTVASMQNCSVQIVSLGDSFTFGWGLDRAEHCMEQCVRNYRLQQPDTSVGHAYVALPKWSPRDYYFAYLEEIRPYKPDIVVVGLFPGNDILKAQVGTFASPKDWQQSKAAFRKQKSRHKIFRWYTLDWAKARMRATPTLANVALKLGSRPTELERFADDANSQAEHWKTTCYYLDQLVRATQEDGVRLVVIGYPSKIQFDSPKELNSGDYKLDMPEVVLRKYCLNKGIAFVSLLNDMQKSPRDLYWPIDRHMNQHGQQVAAKSLFRQLNPIFNHIRHLNRQRDRVTAAPAATTN